MSQSFELSIEQEFSLRSFAEQVKHMSREEAQEFLVNLYQHMMVKESMYQHFLANAWGLDAQPHLG